MDEKIYNSLINGEENIELDSEDCNEIKLTIKNYGMGLSKKFFEGIKRFRM